MSSPITLDQLQVFLAVAEAGSFSGAARNLRRAQSAVSYAIANLERLLDLTLFDRSGRRPTLTAEGRSLLNNARAVTDQVNLLSARAGSMVDGIEPMVSVVVSMMFPMPVLVDALQRFQEQYPMVSLRLYTEALGGVSEMVSNGTCSIGISGSLGAFSHELQRRSLLRIPLIPVVAPSHALCGHSGPLPTALLQNHVQIVLTDRSSNTDGVDEGVLSRNTWRVADLSAKHQLLRAGFGWGNMPQHLIVDDLQNRRLRRLDLEEWRGDTIEVAMYLLSRSSEPPGIAGRWLSEKLLENCARYQTSYSGD